MTGFYWERHPDGPFATLIAVTATYCSPDADAEDYQRPKRLAGREDDQRMRVFKEELRQALASPGELPKANWKTRWNSPTKTRRPSCSASGGIFTTNRPDLPAVPSWTWIPCVLRYASAL